MKDQFSAAAVQGTAALQGTYARFTGLFASRVHAETKALGKLLPIFAFLCLFLFSGFHTIAQNYDTLSVHDAGFQIIAPNQTMTAGQSATLVISLGDANTPVGGAVAFDIELELDKAEFPSSPNFGLSNSWFFTSGSPDTSHVLDASRSSIRLLGERSVGVTGHGNLFEVTLTATASGISAGDMIRQGNGIIMVEDIGFRLAASTVEPVESGLRLYPNPCRNRLRLDLRGEAPERVTLHNVKGNLATELSGADFEKREFDTSRLPRGIYIATIFYKDGRRKVQKLLLI